MYYKVIKDNKVIDVLDNIIYLKWQQRNKIMLLSDLKEAQAILSSDGNTIWHEETLYDLPIEAGEYDTVSIQEIDKYEYKKLKALNMMSPEQIVDELILSLLEDNII